MKRLMLFVLGVMTMTSTAAQGGMMMPIPADEATRVGRLGNGMTYYIRHNEKPKGQADFYILHDVGAIQENDDQQGLAHFLEHMAFNGTKNLPGKTLTEYLETVGVKFGYNLNASTGWDQTTYQIKDVPTARESVIDSALLILHDWSHFIALEGDEIDSERGVICEELRTRDGAAWRSMMAMIKALGKDTKYERRNLIGYLDYLKSFDHQVLRDFYRRWYRPDYQAVIIVGDVDVDVVEQKIKRLMSDIPAPAADAPHKETIVVPDNDAPIVSILSDPEMQGSKIQLFIKRPALPKEMNNTIQAEMLDVIQAYIATMENARLQEIAMQPDAPFLGAGMDAGDVLGVIPTSNHTAFVAVTQDGKLPAGFEALYAEMEKISRFGFTQSEFERAQSDLLRHAERKYANRNDRTNNEFVRICLSNFSKNAPMPDAETEWQIDSMLIQSLDLETVNALAKQIVTPNNQVITVAVPEKEGLATPTEAEILAIRDKVTNAQLEAYKDNAVKEPLLPEELQLKGSPVVSTLEDAAYGTTEWTLANGVKIVVKPTAFKADEVRLDLVSPGGLSALTDEEVPLAEFLPVISSMSGAGKFSATELRKQLSGISASVNIDVDNYLSSIKGVCSPKDIETMLQLLYLNFVQPRFDETDYNTLMKMIRAQLENARSNPDFLMEERYMKVAYGNNPRRRMTTAEITDTFRFETLPGIHRKLFPGADSFMFVFVGNVDPATLRPLAEKYIGSLPVSGRKMQALDDHSAPVEGQVADTFRVAMQQPKVSVHYLFSGKMPYTFANRLALAFLTQALDSRYLISIREEKGGTYGVSVHGSAEYLPDENYRMHIIFDTNEEMADELLEIVMKELERIAADGPLTEDIEKNREFMLKSWKNSLEQNNSWMKYIQSKYASGADYLADYEKALRELTNADVQAMAKKILDDGNLVKVIMRPEQTK